MIKFIPVTLVLLSVAACAPEQRSPGYFDSLTPDPSAFERKRQQDRLIEAEIRAAEATTADAPAEGALAADASATGATPDAPIAGNSPTLSQTQDFAVVKERETIESDASKLQALAESYEVIAPQPLPERTDDVNIAAYAINQTNQVGNKIYIRHPSSDSGCLRYRNDPDEAQRAFLASGGPKLDRRNLDPDGDGFACKWTPDFYRKLVQ